ncbi:MAG: hypothetical protein CL927_08385 [Deltaproteobacteria bacterium]|nr:hypothetical protein [Deltaproteobacteria bacterium]HCH63575.1 hypothetical protein [Deltaproteobacteria bacterium]
MTRLDLGPLRLHGVSLFVRAWSTHGGTERYCHGFARWLIQHDVRPEVWCQRVELPDDGALLRALRPAGRGRVGRMLATNLAVRTASTTNLRVGFLRAPGFDVLRAGGGAHSAWMSRLGATRWADQLERRFDQAGLRDAGTVVVNSELARRDVIADGSASSESVVVVRNGVDLERFSPLAESERDHAVVFVGHGFTRKGLATALSAMVHLPGWELRVVGRDRREAHYRSLAVELGVASQVRFLGAVDDIAPVVRRARALILPTRYDPSANVVLEAMACAVPPVTTRLDGASEVVPMPWLVVDEPTNAIAFAHAIRRAVADRELAARCRAAAEDWSLERSFSAFAATLVDGIARRAERR